MAGLLHALFVFLLISSLIPLYLAQLEESTVF